MNTITTSPEIEAAHADALETNAYQAQLTAWADRHADTPVDQHTRPGTWVLNVYYEADHADALRIDRDRTDAEPVGRYADILRAHARTADHVNWGFVGIIESLTGSGYFPGGDAERLAEVRAAIAARQQVIDELRDAR